MFNHSNIGVFIMSEITKFESAPIANISDFVQIKDEQVYTTSRIVAEKFGKEHKNVIQSIEELIKTMVQPIENIGKLKNQPAKNVVQVIENKAQSNFTFNGFSIEATHWKN